MALFTSFSAVLKNYRIQSRIMVDGVKLNSDNHFYEVDFIEQK